MGYKRKSYTTLKEELKNCHKLIMRLKADPLHADPISARDIMGCFSPASTPGQYFNPNDEVSCRAGYQVLATYTRRGYLRYVPVNKGGQGYEVSEKFLGDDADVKTKIIDLQKNLLNKLKSTYPTSIALLTDIRDVAPSTSMSALMELLKDPSAEPYMKLLKAKPTPAITVTPEELQEIHVKKVEFGGENHCRLNDVNLWQAYQIGRALDTTPRSAEPVLLQDNGQERPTLSSSESSTAPF